MSETLNKLVAQRVQALAVRYRWVKIRRSGPNGSEKVLAALLEEVYQLRGIQPGQVQTNVALAKWQKSAQGMKDLFETCIPVNEHVERSSMRGSPCALVRGNLYCGLHDDNLYFRLDAESREAFMALLGATIFEPNAGHTLSECVEAPLEVLEDANELNMWLERSLEYVMSLPPREGAGSGHV